MLEKSWSGNIPRVMLYTCESHNGQETIQQNVKISLPPVSL